MLKHILTWSIFYCFFCFGFSQVTLSCIDKDRLEVSIEGDKGIFQNCYILTESADYQVQHFENRLIITGLSPATYVEVMLEINRDGKVHVEKHHLMTRSESTGEIRVYFNNPVDTTVGNSQIRPDGTTYAEVRLALQTLIRNAKESIDLAAYNTNEIFLVNELIDAHNRGVRVRVITDDETSNTGWSGGAPFAILKGNLGSGLMHNKFLIVDVNTVNDSWVVTGAMNFTSNQMRRDPNHLIFIQDQSLAKAYEMEFEEMWGSETEQPDVTKARFGNQKTKNTPDQFIINEIPVELYFSPSDGTTGQISRVLDEAKHEVLLGLMIFTNWELRDKVVEKLNQDVKVRWIVDDIENSNSVMQAVKQAQGQVAAHSHPDIFHHKYAIVDEGKSNSVLITGSHNWTFSAETVNDENTLFIYDQGLVNLFKQEFEARWKEIITVNVEEEVGQIVMFYPNPVRDLVYFDSLVGECVIFDVNGGVVAKATEEVKFLYLDIPPGVYFIKIGDNIKKLIKI